MPRNLLLFAFFLLCGACNRPPAGLYETRAYDKVEFVKRDGTPLYMDIFVPQNAPTPRPAVILYHGGGWMFGDRSDERDMARFLATMGYTAATADYRLCTLKGPHYPAPVQDCLAAIKFIRSHAADYGVDPARIAVGGDSAGGQLALMVGLVRDHAVFKDDSFPGVSSDVAAVIDLYGPTDLIPMYEGIGPHRLILKLFAQAYGGGTAQQLPDQYRAASPISHVRSDAPPVLLVHGECDSVVPFDQSVRLHEAIQKAGGRSRLVRVPGAEHGWIIQFNGSVNMRTLPAIANFLGSVFPQGV